MSTGPRLLRVWFSSSIAFLSFSAARNSRITERSVELQTLVISASPPALPKFVSQNSVLTQCTGEISMLVW